MIDCALFEPDIPQNAGSIMRLGACLGVSVHIIHPAGFALTDRNFKRAGLDYLSRSDLREHADWLAFEEWRRSGQRRLVAFSAHAGDSLERFGFRSDDVLVFGRESAGLPEHVMATADARVRVPMRPGNRSLNVATAASIALFEALRQTGQLPA